MLRKSIPIDVHTVTIFFFSAIVANEVTLNDLNTKLKDLLPKLMELDFESKARSDEVYEKLKNYYLNGSDIVHEDNRQGFINVSLKNVFLSRIRTLN